MSLVRPVKLRVRYDNSGCLDHSPSAQRSFSQKSFCNELSSDNDVYEIS